MAGEIFMLEANAIGARRAWVFDFFVLHLPLTRAPRTGRGATAHRAMSDEAPPPAEGEAPEDGEPEPEPEPPFTLTVSVKVRRGRSAATARRAAANRRIFPFADSLFGTFQPPSGSSSRSSPRRRPRPRATLARDRRRPTDDAPTLTVSSHLTSTPRPRAAPTTAGVHAPGPRATPGSLFG